MSNELPEKEKREECSKWYSTQYFQYIKDFDNKRTLFKKYILLGVGGGFLIVGNIMELYKQNDIFQILLLIIMIMLFRLGFSTVLNFKHEADASNKYIEILNKIEKEAKTSKDFYTRANNIVNENEKMKELKEKENQLNQLIITTGRTVMGILISLIILILIQKGVINISFLCDLIK